MNLAMEQIIAHTSGTVWKKTSRKEKVCLVKLPFYIQV